MTADKFKHIATTCGYASKSKVDEYISSVNKDVFDEDDFIKLYRFKDVVASHDGKWRDYQGTRSTKHLHTPGGGNR